MRINVGFGALASVLLEAILRRPRLKKDTRTVNAKYISANYSLKTKKILASSFFTLTTIAILSGVIGAWLSGMWDLSPPGAGTILLVIILSLIHI